MKICSIRQTSIHSISMINLRHILIVFFLIITTGVCVAKSSVVHKDVSAVSIVGNCLAHIVSPFDYDLQQDADLIATLTDQLAQAYGYKNKIHVRISRYDHQEDSRPFYAGGAYTEVDNAISTKLYVYVSGINLRPTEVIKYVEHLILSGEVLPELTDAFDLGLQEDSAGRLISNTSWYRNTKVFDKTSEVVAGIISVPKILSYEHDTFQIVWHDGMFKVYSTKAFNNINKLLFTGVNLLYVKKVPWGGGLMLFTSTNTFDWIRESGITSYKLRRSDIPVVVDKWGHNIILKHDSFGKPALVSVINERTGILTEVPQ